MCFQDTHGFPTLALFFGVSMELLTFFGVSMEYFGAFQVQHGNLRSFHFGDTLEFSLNPVPSVF